MTLKASELKKEQTFEETVVEGVQRLQLVMYAGASGDFNPIHTDEPAAMAAGHPSVFAHGMLTMGVTGRALTNLVGDGRLRKFGGRFTSQVWPGDNLTVHMTVEDVREEDGEQLVDLALSTKNQEDVEVFKGQATAVLDS
jgi:acyl dehydratase